MARSIRSIEREVIRKPAGFLKGFKAFIGQYGVVPLAVAVVIGNAVNDLVKSIVENIITPLIALVSPNGVLQGFQVEFHGSVFKLGLALNALISFVVVAWLVYITAKLVLKDDTLLQKK